MSKDDHLTGTIMVNRILLLHSDHNANKQNELRKVTLEEIFKILLVRLQGVHLSNDPCSFTQDPNLTQIF